MNIVDYEVRGQMLVVNTTGGQYVYFKDKFCCQYVACINYFQGK